MLRECGKNERIEGKAFLNSESSIDKVGYTVTCFDWLAEEMMSFSNESGYSGQFNFPILLAEGVLVQNVQSSVIVESGKY